jgi:hypothetical protein
MVRRAAKRVRGHGMKDRTLRRMYLQDARDLETVARRVARGDKRGAERKANSMDTAAREEIPLEVFCWFAPESVRGGCQIGRAHV